MKPLISVIIPSYNDALYLDDAIASLAKQSFKDIEIIIIDDGSNDLASIKKLEELKQNKSLKIIYKKNGGPGSARNEGINHAVSEYIFTLDADDMLHENCLKLSYDLLTQATPDVAFINSWRELFGDATGIKKKTGYDPYNLAWENCVGNNCLFKKSAWQEVGGYSTNLDGIEDWDFWIKLVGAG